MARSAPRRASCSAAQAIVLPLALIGGLFQSACNSEGHTEGLGITPPPAAVVIFSESSPLHGCFPASVTTERAIRLYNTGSADFVVEAFFDCIYCPGSSAVVTMDPAAFTVPAGDTQGVEVKISITCPDYGEPIFGNLYFYDRAAQATAYLAMSGSCATDVTLCCLTTGWCCPSSAEPPCSEFTDPVYYQTCLKACCPGDGPNMPGCSLYDFP